MHLFRSESRLRDLIESDSKSSQEEDTDNNCWSDNDLLLTKSRPRELTEVSIWLFTSDQFTWQLFVPSGYFWLDSSSVDLGEFATRWRRWLGASFPGDVGKARQSSDIMHWHPRAQFGKLTCAMHDTMGEIKGSDAVFPSLAILLLRYRRENATK